METVQKYIHGLKKAYFDNNAGESWEHFENIKHGALNEDIIKLRDIFPLIPDELICLLKYADGTYWREYQGEKTAFYFFGSDVDEYPYYLFSCEQILENKDAAYNLSDYIDRSFEEDGVVMDDKITNNPDTAKWLHFSDCMNNGGTSALFIDFTPSAIGKAGQILRYLHDPDEIMVIADSFDDYLKMLMDTGYDFINRDTVDE